MVWGPRKRATRLIDVRSPPGTMPAQDRGGLSGAFLFGCLLLPAPESPYIATPPHRCRQGLFPAVCGSSLLTAYGVDVDQLGSRGRVLKSTSALVVIDSGPTDGTVMSNTSRTAAAVVLAWTLLAILVFVLALPARAACLGTQPGSQGAAAGWGIRAPAPRDGCCSRVSAVPGAAIQQPSRVRFSQPVVAGHLPIVRPWPRAANPHGGYVFTPSFSPLGVYALTQRLRL